MIASGSPPERPERRLTPSRANPPGLLAACRGNNLSSRQALSPTGCSALEDLARLDAAGAGLDLHHGLAVRGARLDLLDVRLELPLGPAGDAQADAALLLRDASTLHPATPPRCAYRTIRTCEPW